MLTSIFFRFLEELSDRLGKSVPSIITLPYLQNLPPGTFGRAWADFLVANNLKPLDRGVRRLQIHDGVHVLLGYATSPPGLFHSLKV